MMDKKIYKIALITDAPNWAFANIARNIKLYGSKSFEYRTVAIRDLDVNPLKAIIAFKDFDLIHFFWRDELRALFEPKNRNYLYSLGLTQYEFEQKYLADKKITTSVYDHLYIDQLADSNYSNLFGEVHGYTVSSEKLNTLYSKAEFPPLAVVQDGVDLAKFKPVRREPFSGKRPLKVGWVGNSKWGGHGDHKGLVTIIRPAVKILKSKGLDIVEIFADRAVKQIPHSEMAEYYNSIDLLYVASIDEGTPNPILEAMASGIPFISTDVGIVPEIAGQLQSSFIVPVRSPQAFASATERLLSSPENFLKIGEENLESVKGWSWHNQVQKFEEFFLKVLNG